MNCWDILAIEPTTDTKQIKHAYARLLKTVDQEQEVERFQALRSAYEQALEMVPYLQASPHESSFEPAVAEPPDVRPQNEFQGKPSQAESPVWQVESITAAISPPSAVSAIAADPSEQFNPYAYVEGFMGRVNALYEDRAARNSVRKWQALFREEPLQDIEVKNLLRYRMFEFLCQRVQVMDFASGPNESVAPKVVRFLNKFFCWTEDELALARQFPTDRVDAIMYAIHGSKGVSLNQRVERRTRQFSWSSLVGWLMLLVVLTNLFRHLVEK